MSDQITLRLKTAPSRLVWGNTVLGVFPDTVAGYLQGGAEDSEHGDFGGLANFYPKFDATLGYTTIVNPVVPNATISRKFSDVELNYEGWDEVATDDNPFTSNKARYYFDINFSNFKLSDEQTPFINNNFRTVITSLLNKTGFAFSGMRTISTGSQNYMDSLYGTAVNFDLVDMTAPGFQPLKAVDAFTGDTEDLEKTEDATYSPNPDYGDNYSPQATIFGKMIQKTWSPYLESKDSILIVKYCQTQLSNYVYSAILTKLALKISQNAQSWVFGYDPTISPKIILLDDYEKYGGDPDMPPFYVENPQYGGWLGLYDKLVPEVDNCERQPIIDFKNISVVVNKWSDKFTDDPRLTANPECVIEPPYSRILAKGEAAAIEGSIVAIIRLYVVESFIKSMPVFSLFESKYPDTFDEVLFGYISEKMLEDLLELGRGMFLSPTIKKETFYYTFLEQVVQNFGRKIALGDIVPTAAEQEALDQINYIVGTWVEPTGYYKKRKKRKAFEKYMKVTAPYAKTILTRYVREELEEVSKLFKESLNPSIHDLSSLVFGSPNWMVGSLTQGGPLDVPTAPLSDIHPTSPSSDEIILEDIFAPDKNSGFEDTFTTLSNLTSDKKGGYFPFVLEKYIMVENYTDAEKEDLNSPRAHSPHHTKPLY